MTLSVSPICVQQKGEAVVQQGLIAGKRCLWKCKGALDLPLILGEAPVGVGWWVWLWVWSKIRDWRGHCDFMFFYVYSLVLGRSENLYPSSIYTTTYAPSAMCHPKIPNWDPAELFTETQSLAGLCGGPQCYDQDIVLTIYGCVEVTVHLENKWAQWTKRIFV